MPNGWVHATIDLIVFGRSYFDLHHEKDKACGFLGAEHRIVNHEWYQAFGRVWTFSDPFPSWLKGSMQALGDAEGADKAEEQMVLNAHEYLDRVWDGLSAPERKYWESFFIWVLFHPRILKDWAGVDVVNGRIHRVVENQEIWETCPDVKSEYQRLCRYTSVVRHNDETLRDILGRDA
jgi:hypothetical protein